MRIAREALIEPTPDNSLRTSRIYTSSQQSPVSPSLSREKIRRTQTAVEKPRAKRPLKKYGSQGQDIFEFHGASDGRSISTSPKQQQLQNVKQKQSRDVHGNIGTCSSGDTEVMEWRTNRADNGISSGSSMPPPVLKPKSFEHVEGSAESIVVGSLLRLGPFDSKCPYPDGKVGRSTGSFEVQGDGVHFLDDSIYRLRERCEDEIEAVNEQRPGLKDSSSNASLVPSTKTTEVENGTQQSSFLHEGRIQEDLIPLPQPAAHFVARPTDSIINVLPEGQDEKTIDELSAPATDFTIASKVRMKSSGKREVTEIQMVGLDSDDDAIGLPKDNYQPRPTKSRSSRGNEEVLIPDDYSKRPEAVSRKKRKLSRRKTTAFHELLPKDEDDDEEDEVIRYKSTVHDSKTSKHIPNRYEFPCKVTDNAEVERETLATMLESTMKPIESARQRGRPKKAALTESAEFSILEEEHVDLYTESTAENSMARSKIRTTEVHDPLEAKKQRGRPKKQNLEGLKGMPSAEADDESLKHNTESAQSNHLTIAKKPLKHGKAAEVPIAISEELVQDRGEDPDRIACETSCPEKALETIDGNIMTPSSPPKARSSPSPSKAKPSPPGTPQKLCPLHKGPDKHSPISSGKVAYRVGLSKRQRIAPLLTMVRKC